MIGDPHDQSMATVLIVDGNDLVRGSMRRILESAGHKVIEAPDIREAPSLCALTLARTVIIEVASPVEIHLETIRQLRDECPGAAVVALSADGQAYLELAKKAGATDVLAKPFDDVELIDAVARGLSRQRK